MLICRISYHDGVEWWSRTQVRAQIYGDSSLAVNCCEPLHGHHLTQAALTHDKNRTVVHTTKDAAKIGATQYQPCL